jgi:hypothetical protein
LKEALSRMSLTSSQTVIASWRKASNDKEEIVKMKEDMEAIWNEYMVSSRFKKELILADNPSSSKFLFWRMEQFNKWKIRFYGSKGQFNEPKGQFNESKDQFNESKDQLA